MSVASDVFEVNADRELVGWAIAIICNVDAPDVSWPNQTEEWRVAARKWLDEVHVSETQQ